MKNKEISASFAVTHQSAKVTAAVCEKWLVKMEKALHVIMGMYVQERRHIQVFSTICGFGIHWASGNPSP